MLEVTCMLTDHGDRCTCTPSTEAEKTVVAQNKAARTAPVGSHAQHRLASTKSLDVSSNQLVRILVAVAELTRNCYLSWPET